MNRIGRNQYIEVFCRVESAALPLVSRGAFRILKKYWLLRSNCRSFFGRSKWLYNIAQLAMAATMSEKEAVQHKSHKSYHNASIYNFSMASTSQPH